MNQFKIILLVVILNIFVINSLLAQYNDLDTINLQVKSWQIDLSQELLYQEIDTTLTNIHYCYPYQNIFNFSTTRLVSPSESSVFNSQHLKTGDFLFVNNYKAYIFSPLDIKYYNIKKPYTDVTYISSQKKKEEQYLNLLHTQNINSKTNVGISYHLITAKDMANSSNQNSNSNNFVVFASHIGKRYILHTALINNKIRIFENGGMQDTGSFNIKNISYFFNNAVSQIGVRNFFISHQYKIGKTNVIMINDSTFNKTFTEKMSLTHVLNYQSSFHKFYKATLTDNYFSELNFNNTFTNDSVHYNKISNVFQIKSKKYAIGKYNFSGNIGVENEILSFYNFTEYLIANKNKYKTNNNLIVSLNKIKIRNFDADVKLKYCLAGYNLADLEMITTFKTAPILSIDSASSLQLEIKYEHKEPSYYIQQYFSNHNKWTNEFKKQKNISLSISFLSPRVLNLQINNYFIYDYIYFDTLSKPSQYDKSLFVNNISIGKQIKFWKIKSNSKIIIQNISNQEIINLPILLFYNSTYIEGQILRKSLFINLGYDFYYTTEHYSYNYNPSTGLLYQNLSYRAGGYPMLSTFLKMKIRNAILFFSVENIIAASTEEYQQNITQYHFQEIFYRFGVKWWFSD